MDDMMLAGSSPAPNTGPAVDNSAPAAAAASPTSTPGSAVDTSGSQPPGPIPFDRHKAILDGAYAERDTARREFEEYKQRYQWASEVDPSEFQQLQRWSSAYREDPVRWMAETIAELRQAYPHLAPALTSEAARILAGSRGFQAEPEIDPDIPVLDAQGQVVSQAYSADRVKQLIARQVAEALGREVGPLKQTVEQQQSRARVQEARAEAIETADAQFAQAQSWHGFAEHKAAIAKAFETHPRWTLQDAYLHVLHTEILPQLDQKSQGKLLTHLQTQAAGSTVRPDGSGTPRPKFKADQWKEALEYFEAHPEHATP